MLKSYKSTVDVSICCRSGLFPQNLGGTVLRFLRAKACTNSSPVGSVHLFFICFNLCSCVQDENSLPAPMKLWSLLLFKLEAESQERSDERLESIFEIDGGNFVTDESFLDNPESLITPI